MAMNTQIRKRDEIYHIEGGWFSGYWHFSFDTYRDPENTRFGTLRVFNVDTLVPGGVWPLHPHHDIEVITYCADGEFEHGDNLGNDGVLYPGDVQHTTVGSGLWHSEINHSKEKPMTFIQVWIFPRESGLPPSIEQRHVKPEERLNKLLPLVSNIHPDALPIQQDARVYASTLEPRARLEHALAPGQGVYLYVISGDIRLNDHAMTSGDAAKVWSGERLDIQAVDRSDLFMVVVQV